ncbi:MAG: phytanoyl-CoA dioxygenase family protein [Halioglobus sp.]|nr:phytanoyl-CoA dioxygenase family protein [Halioglobus sp.]
MTTEAVAEIEKIIADPRPLSAADLGRLAVLRHEIGALHVAQAPRRLPPEPSRDLFAGVKGLPEVSGAELTGEHVASGLRLHGALLVRNLVSDRDVATLRSLIDGRDWTMQQRPCDAEGHVLPGSAPMKCSAASLQGLVEAYQHAGMYHIMSDYLGEPPVLLSERLLIDKQRFETGLPWHEDGAFFGGNVGGVNSFLALDTCGVEAVGLGVVARRFTEVLGVKEGERANLVYNNSLEDEDVVALAGADAVVTPLLEAGDAILIDEMTLHRTGRRPKTGQLPRSWAITWFFAPSRFPAQRHPLWLGP